MDATLRRLHMGCGLCGPVLAARAYGNVCEHTSCVLTARAARAVRPWSAVEVHKINRFTIKVCNQDQGAGRSGTAIASACVRLCLNAKQVHVCVTAEQVCVCVCCGRV